MKSAVADLMAAFFEGGGKVTRCPDGNGLMPFELRPRQAVGNAKRLQRAHLRIQRAVLEALASQAPLTLLGIEKATGIPFDSLRGAVNVLALDGKILVTQAAARQTRWFSLADANTGTGDMTGGPASESAAGACVGKACSPAVRPGSEGASRSDQTKSEAA